LRGEKLKEGCGEKALDVFGGAAEGTAEVLTALAEE